MKDKASGCGACAVQIIFIGISTVQLFAVFSCAHNVWGWGWFGSCLIAALLSYIPLIGSIAGIYGAVQAWGWPWWGACLLFFWSFAFAIVLTIIEQIWTFFDRRRL